MVTVQMAAPVGNWQWALFERFLKKVVVNRKTFSIVTKSIVKQNIKQNMKNTKSTTVKSVGAPAKSITFPTGKFTFAELVAANPHMCGLSARNKLMKALDTRFLTKLPDVITSDKPGRPQFTYTITVSVKSSVKSKVKSKVIRSVDVIQTEVIVGEPMVPTVVVVPELIPA